MNNLAEKPDVFNLIETYEDRCIKDLTELINNNENISTVEGLEKSKKVFDSIRLHLKQEDALISNVENNPELKNSVKIYRKKKGKILEQLNNLLLHHVDEPEFLKALKKLRGQIKVLAEFEDTKLHKRLKRYLSPRIL